MGRIAEQIMVAASSLAMACRAARGSPNLGMSFLSSNSMRTPSCGISGELRVDCSISIGPWCL